MSEYKFVHIGIIYFISPSCCALQEWPPPGFFSRDRIRYLIWWDKFFTFKMCEVCKHLSLLECCAFLGPLCPEGEGTTTLRSVKNSPPSWHVVTSQTTYLTFMLFMIIFRRVRKIAKQTISFVISVRPSVHMEQLDSHWTELHEMWYLSIFRKPAEEIQVKLKFDKNKGHFTLRPIYIFDHVLLSYS
jgi:hypothetical protein